MAKSKPITLALIDSHALIHRAYHALPPMSTKAGVPTNAVYGFTTMLLKVLTAIKPTHVVAAFDMKGPTFRHEAYAEYKAHRPKAEPELIVQFDLVRDLVRAFNIPILESQGFEADDIVGTIASGLDGSIKKIIVTGDMDTLQLVNPSTTVFTLRRGVTDTVAFDEAAVRERYGFGPEHVIDYKGLRGDPSDNIPGVAGVGEKTALTLVAKYGSIENIYKHFDELPPPMQKKLEGKEKEALFSRELATIKCDVPLEFELTQAHLEDYDVADVRAIFERLEFRSFLQKLPKSSRPSGQLTLTGKVVAPTLIEMPEHYHLVNDAAAQKKLQAELAQEKVIAFDTETDRLGARQSPIVGMSFAVRRGKQVEAWYVPVTPKTVKAWQPLLENPKVGKVGHNIKYDYAVLQQSGITLTPIVFDTMIASYLVNATSRQYSLDALANSELNTTTIPITQLIGSGREQKGMSEVPLNDIAVYAAEDAEVTFKLYEHFAPKIESEKLTEILQEYELLLIPVLADMELTGVRVDTARLSKLGLKVQKRLTELKTQIQQQAGEAFNINSTQQLRRILYEKLAISTDGIGRTQTGYSTAAAELEKLRDRHPIIALLEEYRELNKLLNTYIETLPKLVDRQTHRIYTSFNQTIAATGRLSSTDPNLQNIPVRTELGQEIRAAFVADKGMSLIKADYSQLELRLAAHLAQDKKMLAAFKAGEDIHRATAAWVYGIPQDKVTDVQRRQAKTLNFGVLYGMGARKFAQTAGLSLEQARSFIERYKEQYRGITKLVETTIAKAQIEGYVETFFGRRRYIPEIKAKSPGIRAQAERIAFNFPIQGTEADILKKAMIELHNILQADFPKAHLVLTVHDELVIEAPTKQAKEVAKIMKRVMENVHTFDVPLTVDVAIGPNWRDTKAVAA